MEKENRKDTSFDKILKFLIISCFVFFFLFVLWGNLVSPNLGLFHETADIYDRDWIRDYEDGHTELFTMPTSLEMEDGETVIIRTVLPMSVRDGSFLTITMGKSYRAYVETRVFIL